MKFAGLWRARGPVGKVWHLHSHQGEACEGLWGGGGDGVWLHSTETTDQATSKGWVNVDECS